jgi:hypothetical protein
MFEEFPVCMSKCVTTGPRDVRLYNMLREGAFMREIDILNWKVLQKDALL